MGRERPGIFEILGQAGYYIEWAKPALSERATPHHTAALAIPGERTGVVPEFGERGFLKSRPPGDDLPGTVHFISASGRALDCGRQKGEFKSPCVFSAVLRYCCTILAPWWHSSATRNIVFTVPYIVKHHSGRRKLRQGSLLIRSLLVT